MTLQSIFIKSETDIFKGEISQGEEIFGKEKT